MQDILPCDRRRRDRRPCPDKKPRRRLCLVHRPGTGAMVGSLPPRGTIGFSPLEAASVSRANRAPRMGGWRRYLSRPGTARCRPRHACPSGGRNDDGDTSHGPSHTCGSRVAQPVETLAKAAHFPLLSLGGCSCRYFSGCIGGALRNRRNSGRTGSYGLQPDRIARYLEKSRGAKRPPLAGRAGPAGHSRRRPVGGEQRFPAPCCLPSPCS